MKTLPAYKHKQRFDTFENTIFETDFKKGTGSYRNELQIRFNEWTILSGINPLDIDNNKIDDTDISASDKIRNDKIQTIIYFGKVLECQKDKIFTTIYTTYGSVYSGYVKDVSLNLGHLFLESEQSIDFICVEDGETSIKTILISEIENIKLRNYSRGAK